jgi:hypothetical protein
MLMPRLFKSNDPFVDSLHECIKRMGLAIGGTFDTTLREKPGDVDTVSNHLAGLYDSVTHGSQNYEDGKKYGSKFWGGNVPEDRAEAVIMAVVSSIDDTISYKAHLKISTLYNDKDEAFDKFIGVLSVFMETIKSKKALTEEEIKGFVHGTEEAVRDAKPHTGL